MGAPEHHGGRFAAAAAAARSAFIAALARGDARAASAVYAQDATLLPPLAGPVRGRDTIAAFWRAGLDAGVAAIELEPFSVDGGERLGYEAGRYELLLEPGGANVITERGSYLLVHALQPDGAWRWAAEMFRPDGPPDVSRSWAAEAELR